MVLIDSSVWIDFFRGIDSRETILLQELLSTDRVAIGDLIITELLQGFRTQKHLNMARDIIRNLYYYDLVGKQIAEKAAENFRILRKKGITVRKTIDVIIGTFCIENNVKLLHNDRDFRPMQENFGLICV